MKAVIPALLLLAVSAGLACAQKLETERLTPPEKVPFEKSYPTPADGKGDVAPGWQEFFAPSPVDPPYEPPQGPWKPVLPNCKGCIEV